MIVRSREDQLEALQKSFSFLSNIMLSSAYNSHKDPEFKDIINFDEFCEVHKKIGGWVINFEKRMEEIKKIN